MAAAKAGMKIVPDHYIVSFKKGTFPYETALSGSRDSQWYDTEGRTLHERTVKEVSLLGGELTHVYTHGSGAFAAYLTPGQVKRLAASPNIERIEPVHVGRINATSPTFSTLWGPDRINQRQSTDTNGQSFLDGNQSWNANGSGVHIYVVDTGIRATHREFVGRIGDGCPLAQHPSPNITINYSAFSDQNGHGTHVAGIAAGSTLGVAHNATIHPVRVSLDGSVGEDAVLDALNWISRNHRDPAVVNMSFYLPSVAATTQVALGEVINGVPATGAAPARTPVTVVAAAGNGLNSDGVGRAVCQWPSNVPQVITVGATGATSSDAAVLYFDARPGYSNFGPMVDIWAPGTNITSAWFTGDSDTYVANGTSMAAPFVAGAAALYLQNHPRSTPVEVRNSIVANATRGAIPFISPTDDSTYGPNRILYVGNEWLDNDRVIVDGSGRLVLTNASVDGKYYDQVLLTGQSVRVHADDGQFVRVSWIDANDDIVQAEFSGCGNFVVSLAPGYSGPAAPTIYNPQYYPDGTRVLYMKGTASFMVEAPSENTNFGIYAVGPATAPGSGPLFKNNVVYTGRSNVALLDFWNPNLGTEAQNRMSMAAIRTGNAVYAGSSGMVGIHAGLVDVKIRAVVGDIKASGTAIPYFEFGRFSAFVGPADKPDLGRPIVAGGDLVQLNTSRVVIAESFGDNLDIPGFTQLWTSANNTAGGVNIAAQPLSNAKLKRSVVAPTVQRMPYFCKDPGLYFPAPVDGLTAP